MQGVFVEHISTFVQISLATTVQLKYNVAIAHESRVRVDDVSSPLTLYNTNLIKAVTEYLNRPHHITS